MKTVTTTQATTTAFKVGAWRPFQKNTLLGFLTLELPSGLIVNDICLHSKNGERWTSMPARQFEKDGQKSWSPIVQFADKETRQDFQELALAAIDDYLQGASE